MPFRMNVSPDQLENLFKDLDDELTNARNNRSVFDKRRIAITNATNNMVRKKLSPWPGCSNTSLPILTRVEDRMVIHAMQTIAPRGSFSRLTAVEVSPSPMKEARDAAADVQDLLGYYFRNRMSMATRFDPFVRSLVRYGNAIGMVSWFRREAQARMVERMPGWEELPRSIEDMNRDVDSGVPEQDVRATEDTQIPIERSMDEYIGGRKELEVEELKPLGSGYKRKLYRYWNSEEKRRVEVEVEGYYDDDSRENVVLAKTMVRTNDEPRFDFVDLDDVYWTTDTDSILDCRAVFVRHPEMTVSDIRQRKRRKIFSQLTDEGMQEIEDRIDRGESGVEKTTMRAMSHVDRPSPTVRDRLDRMEGYQTQSASEVDVWEVFVRMDLDGDGEDEELVVWLERNTKHVLRVANLYEDYHNPVNRPFVQAKLKVEGNRALGKGMGETLMPLKVELDAQFNSRADAASVALNPGGWYRTGSTLPPGGVRTAPGTWLPIDNPQTDLRENVVGTNSRETVQVEGMLLAMIEDLSIGPFSTGSGPAGSKAPETARGTLSMIQQDAIKMDYLLMRLMPALERVCHLTLFLIATNGRDEETFRVVGSEVFKTVRREDLYRGYNFYFDLDSVSANKEVNRIFSAQALQGAFQVAMLPPERVPDGARRLVRRFLEALDVKDANAIIPDPPNYMRPPQDQDAETVVMVRFGVPIEPVLADNHIEHLQQMDAFEGSELFRSQTAEWTNGVWKPHKQKHIILQQQVEEEIRRTLQGIGGGPGRPAGNSASEGVAGIGGIAGDTGPEYLGSTFSGGGAL